LAALLRAAPAAVSHPAAPSRRVIHADFSVGDSGERPDGV